MLYAPLLHNLNSFPAQTRGNQSLTVDLIPLAGNAGQTPIRAAPHVNFPKTALIFSLHAMPDASTQATASPTLWKSQFVFPWPFVITDCRLVVSSTASATLRVDVMKRAVTSTTYASIFHGGASPSSSSSACPNLNNVTNSAAFTAASDSTMDEGDVLQVYLTQASSNNFRGCYLHIIGNRVR